MPIKSVTTIPPPGYLVHTCAACGAEHTISFDRGAQKTKTGPFALRPGDTLVVVIDAAPPSTATFAAGAFPDFARVTAAQLAAVLSAAIPGLRARDDRGGVLLESGTLGDASHLRIVDGMAREALGFPVDGRDDLCSSRPVLGLSMGDIVDDNVVVLRRCNDCGANECLVRTFDEAGAHLDGTHLKEHRKAVNAVAEHCRARGWSHPAVAARHAAETMRPPDIHPALGDHLIVLPGNPFPTGAVPRPIRDESR